MTNPLMAAADHVQMLATSRGKGPKTELGTELPDAPSALGGSLGMGAPNWSYFTRGDDLEHVPELQWQPNGRGLVGVYHKMRGDSQCQGLYLGCTMPIRRYGFFIEPNGARDKVVKALADDYNLPIRGQENKPRGRSQRRFVFHDWLRHALLALIYGHMFFEQVGEVTDHWHLRKLGVRMPQSIQEINIAQDGGLQSIVQRGMGVTSGGRKRQIDVGRLLAMVWEREGANWTGRSLFRGIYKNYLLKDTVLRVGAINIERAGGVPVIKGPKGATPEDLGNLGQMARAFRVGANAGGAIPNGAELELVVARNAGKDAVDYIKLQNEEMARGWLMMFLNLGQAGSHGSYAMSDSFIDYTLNTQEVVAQWVCDIFNEHMIEDHVNWAFGEDEQVPLLVYKRTDDRQMAIQDLVKLIDAGAISVGDELESWIREEYKMPRFDPSAPVRQRPAAGSPPSGADQPASEEEVAA
jgi:hypothetical protein